MAVTMQEHNIPVQRVGKFIFWRGPHVWCVHGSDTYKKCSNNNGPTRNILFSVDI